LIPKAKRRGVVETIFLAKKQLFYFSKLSDVKIPNSSRGEGRMRTGAAGCVVMPMVWVCRARDFRKGD
jgi:hypothetical protein